jgi:serine kinase of HPr protein (carbohydrate metabolism regulator)
MSGGEPASVHASAVLVGDRAVLIRGASGSGKSRLAFDLILAGRAGQIAPALLVGDDRVLLEARHGVLLVRPVRQLAGLIEVRGLGIRSFAHAAEAAVGLVVDLDAADGNRLPAPEACRITLAGVELPRIPVAPGFSPLPLVVAALTTTEGSQTEDDLADCPKGIGNHMRRTLATD